MNDPEVDTAPQRATALPRTSRLPRASGTSLNVDIVTKTSQIPRPSNSKTLPPQSLHILNRKEYVSNVSKSDLGPRSDPIPLDSSDNASAATALLRDEPLINQDDPHRHAPIDGTSGQDGDSATTRILPTSTAHTAGDAKRKKPRPSLSERTIETMSQIPPSPSPSRRKSSVTGAMGSMPPPSLPTSPTGRRSPLAQKLQSPDVRSTGAGIPHIPTLRPSKLQTTPQSTPVRAKSYGSQRIPTSTGRSGSQITEPSLAPTSATKSIPVAHKVRSLRDLRVSATKQPSRKASLNFQDIRINTSDDIEAAPSSQVNDSPVRPRTGQTSTPSKLRKRPSLFNSKAAGHESVLGNGPSIKSSASLRETIAQAKAAKGKVNSQFTQHDDSISAFQNEGISPQALKRRVQSAITSGTLNVAALGLQEISKEILQMYDHNDGSSQNWSEAVDLTKFIIADNNLEDIPDVVFPDWSIEELQNDEDKMNIFGGLELLDLRGNCLAQLPVGIRRLERLSSLNLSNNKFSCSAIETICQISGLRELYLSNNKLTGKLPQCMEQLTQLHTLDLHDNKITSVDLAFASMQALRKLDLSGNDIATLSTVELENLGMTDLDASRNSLSTFVLSKNCKMLATLQNLNLAFNNLESLWSNDACCPQLHSLIVDSNRLSAFPNLAGCSNLITLTVSQNRLDDLPDGFVELQSLRTANLSGNNIRVLDPYISRMENLSVLNLASNPLRDRKYLNMSTPDVKAELAKRLTAVLVREESSATPTPDQGHDGTNASGIFKIEKGALDLSGRNLAMIEASENEIAETVSSIDLSRNSLQDIPAQLLVHHNIRSSLKSLIVSHNTSFDPTVYITAPLTLSNLRSLSLATTGIASIDALTAYLSAPLLAELNLSCNHLKGSLPTFRNVFPALITLLISDNELTSITPNAITGLEVVDVQNNEIEFLPPKIGELGNVGDEKKPGRLRTFQCTGNKFRVPRLGILEKGTEAILRDLRRMVITDELGEEWRE